MINRSVEECPVCWRSYSSSVRPMTITCGHSYCEECSAILTKCALCRKTVKPHKRATNYSLLSLVSKLEQSKVEMVDKQVGTDGVVTGKFSHSASRPTEKTQDVVLAMKILLKMTAISSQLARQMIMNSKAIAN